MGDRNYLVPLGSMSLIDQKEYRLGVLAAGLNACMDHSIGSIKDEIPGLIPGMTRDSRISTILNYIKVEKKWPESVDQAEFQPLADLVLPAVALDEWLTAPLAAVGTAYSCFQAIPAPQLPAGRLAVFFGVSIDTVPPPVTRLDFRHAAVTGQLLAVFNLEDLFSRDEMAGFFSEPVVILPNQTFVAQVRCSIATGVPAKVPLMAYTFKNAGQKTA